MKSSFANNNQNTKYYTKTINTHPKNWKYQYACLLAAIATEEKLTLY